MNVKPQRNVVGFSTPSLGLPGAGGRKDPQPCAATGLGVTGGRKRTRSSSAISTVSGAENTFYWANLGSHSENEISFLI